MKTTPTKFDTNKPTTGLTNTSNLSSNLNTMRNSLVVQENMIIYLSQGSFSNQDQVEQRNYILEGSQ